MIAFHRGQGTSNAVQIDHVVAVGEAYESGADRWTKDRRVAYANDSYVLLAVKGSANASKSDKDAAHWLPGHGYDCAYVSRQIGIKQHYHLAVDSSEKMRWKLPLHSVRLVKQFRSMMVIIRFRTLRHLHPSHQIPIHPLHRTSPCPVN